MQLTWTLLVSFCAIVGNIPYEQTEEQLIEIFSEVGPVVSFRYFDRKMHTKLDRAQSYLYINADTAGLVTLDRLVFERETAKPRGYGFCEFQDERTAASAVRNLNGRDIGNRSLKVDFAESDPARNGGRDLEEGSFMRNIAGGPPAGGPIPPRNMGGPPHPPFMAPQQGRVDPRMGSNMPPGGRPPMVPQPGVPPPPPAQIGGAGPPGPNSADAISAVLATMTPQNVFDLISSMKVLGATEPDRAKAVLNANPQLSYALFQALLMMNLVEPSSLQVRALSFATIHTSVLR